VTAPPLRADPRAPALLVSPHLDDAVWSAYAVLAGDGPVDVVNVFAGVPPAGVDAWWDRRCGIADSPAHVRARIAEDEAALATLGRRAVNLPLLDGQYRVGGPQSLAEARAALTERVEGASVVYGPAGIGAHEDHVFARELVLSLAADGIPVHLYADYSYCARGGWPTWVDRAAGRPEGDAQWRRDLAGVPVDPDRPRVRELSEDERRRKLAVMRLYRTQYDMIEQVEPEWQIDGRPPSDARLLRFEVVFPVRGHAVESGP
jgi:LmbE family N-acetylglucosaminyl deacetylase